MHSYFKENPTKSSVIKYLYWDWLNKNNRNLTVTVFIWENVSVKFFFETSSHLPIGCDLSRRFLISWSFSSIAWCRRTWNSLSFWTNSSNNLWSNGKKAHIFFSLNFFRKATLLLNLNWKPSWQRQGQNSSFLHRNILSL